MSNVPFFYKIKSSLAKKMLYAILISSTIITSFILAIQLYFEYKTNVSYIEQRLTQVEKSYSNALALSVWTFDTGQYRSQLQGILNLEDIVYVKVLNSQNEEIISQGIPQKINKIDKEFILQTQIFGKSVIVGKVHMEATLERVYDELLNRAFIILITQGIKTLFISFVILFIFHILVVRYLRGVAQYTQNINFDNHQDLVLQKKFDNDEIDQIVTTINKMKNNVSRQKIELLDINKTLETKVEQRTKELQELLFVQSKLASMGQMIENITHQWRQPLYSINTSIMLLDGTINKYGIKDKIIEKNLDEIEEITSYLSRTIDDLRNFYSNKKQKVDFDLFELITQSTNIVSSSYNKNNIILDISSKLKHITLHTFKNELQQVLISLLINAKDILLQRKIQNPKVSIDVQLDEDLKQLVISICDNGGGVQEKNISKIFDLYFTTKAKKEGSGIGLYIAKMIVEQSLEGTIDVSNKNDGACFTIVLDI